jgi:2-dehydro-3-deoxygluconokinase
VSAYDIVAIGEPMIEFNQTRGTDARAYLQGFGGDTSNMAIAAARLGARVAYDTRLGNDAFGRMFMQLWREEGVGTDGVAFDPEAPTGVYFVAHGPAGHEFSYLRAGSAASRIVPQDIPAGLIEGARIVHASGISQAISSSAADTVFVAMRAARAAGVAVSYDTNLRLRLWPLDRARAVIHAAAALADILLPSLDDAMHLTGLADPDRILDIYLGLGAKIVALTLGGRGVVVATPDRRESIAPRPAEPVDATGAGDAFDGAFLAEYLRVGDPFAAARYANVAAALSTEGYGAVAPIPRRAAVEAAMRKAG